jgi:hypothetical protein
VGFTALIFDYKVSNSYYLALFFGSIAGYNAIKYHLKYQKYTQRVPGRLSFLAFLSLFSLGLGCYFLTGLPRGVWVFFFIAGLITALYSVPLKPGGVNLRSYGFLKVILVALVWTILSVWAPLWGGPQVPSWDIGVESFQRMLWVFLLMLPFEIRDMRSDPPEMKSIPQRLGIPLTRSIGWGVAMVFALVTWFKDAPGAGEFAAKVAIAVLLGLSIAFAPEKQNRYYAAFWVEGIPIAALGLLILFRG